MPAVLGGCGDEDEAGVQGGVEARDDDGLVARGAVDAIARSVCALGAAEAREGMSQATRKMLERRAGAKVRRRRRVAHLLGCTKIYLKKIVMPMVFTGDALRAMGIDPRAHGFKRVRY